MGDVFDGMIDNVLRASALVADDPTEHNANLRNRCVAETTAYVAHLRAAVRAADAMARALLDKSSGAHECNGGPERCWYCADAESDRAVVSAFDQARAKGDV